ncbi:hypothetical protein CLIB1444_02S16644 [[Candida] jaroonii]|uniref:Uncharacterized protein n=1 Tax=[Candida] jaroonii TaxID=467808 RepID=A0ACA9Y487_9ASCO|nr:hypothetical protein CLIB1444_02S16644 [[Candida] jaroonii]
MPMIDDNIRHTSSGESYEISQKRHSNNQPPLSALRKQLPDLRASVLGFQPNPPKSTLMQVSTWKSKISSRSMISSHTQRAWAAPLGASP